MAGIQNVDARDSSELDHHTTLYRCMSRMHVARVSALTRCRPATVILAFHRLSCGSARAWRCSVAGARRMHMRRLSRRVRVSAHVDIKRDTAITLVAADGVIAAAARGVPVISWPHFILAACVLDGMMMPIVPAAAAAADRPQRKNHRCL